MGCRSGEMQSLDSSALVHSTKRKVGASRGPGCASSLRMTSGSTLCALLASKEQRRERGEVSAPDHPGMRAGGFDVGEGNVLRLEPSLEPAIIVNEVVAGAAGDPQHAQLSGLL